MKKVIKDIFSELMFNILKIYIIFVMIYHFYQKVRKLKKVEKLVGHFFNITEYVTHIRNLK